MFSLFKSKSGAGLPKLRKFDDNLFICGQITPEAVAELPGMGIRGIICNRPDGEGANQPTAREIQDAAQQHGMDFRYIPVVGGRIGQSDVDAFAQALSEMDGPVLAFCFSGNRSTFLARAAQK